VGHWVQAAGRYPLGVTPASATIDITGMHCSSCVALIEETLGDRPGIESINVDLEAGKAELSYDLDAIRLDDVCSTIAGLGYGASVQEG
jgi:copper chaperone